MPVKLIFFWHFIFSIVFEILLPLYTIKYDLILRSVEELLELENV